MKKLDSRGENNLAARNGGRKVKGQKLKGQPISLSGLKKLEQLSSIKSGDIVFLKNWMA